jgi:hypothetical protein
MVFLIYDEISFDVKADYTKSRRGRGRKIIPINTDLL